ncbi:MAG TPA: histidine phosphatase family protein [Burkholderiales bacterium]|nr:histidine phosphatase family protein [Burkholderiales bacterium]
MDLILWRHADAEDGKPDLARELTDKGRKQAARVAKWLAERLPKDYRLLSSPAARALQTAKALGAPQVVEALAPGATSKALLKAAQWPDDGTVVLVGHQPDLGRACAYLVSGANIEWSIKKGGLWWIASRTREEETQVVVRAVVSPDLF